MKENQSTKIKPDHKKYISENDRKSVSPSTPKSGPSTPPPPPPPGPKKEN